MAQEEDCHLLGRSVSQREASIIDESSQTPMLLGATGRKFLLGVLDSLDQS